MNINVLIHDKRDDLQPTQRLLGQICGVPGTDILPLL